MSSSARIGPYVCARCLHAAQKQPSYSKSWISTSTASTTTPLDRNAPPPRPPPTQPKAHIQKAAPDLPIALTNPEILNSYWQTNPPTPHQLAHARRFFLHHKPQFLFSAAKFREFPISDTPEVCFVGRSNVGKSSLLNALFNRTSKMLAWTSSKPGRTRVMNAFRIGEVVAGEESGGGVKSVGVYDRKKGREVERKERWVGRGGVVVVDMPGYGAGSREEWGREIMKYLRGRKQLRRVFILIDAQHGLKSSDKQLTDFCRDEGVSHQLIVSKIDKIVYPKSTMPSGPRLQQKLEELRSLHERLRQQIQPQDVLSAPAALGEIVTCSAEKSVERGQKIGIDGLRWAVLQAANLGCDERGAVRGMEVNVLEEDD